MIYKSIKYEYNLYILNVKLYTKDKILLLKKKKKKKKRPF